MNPLRKLHDAGQSVWLDYLRRSLITDGGLARLVAGDAVGGMTSNPTIFAQAMTGSADYDAAIAQLATAGARDPREIFYALALDDVRRAADVLRPVWEATRGADGYVSFELEPSLAHDAAGSVAGSARSTTSNRRPWRAR